jgi:hypothetical protein
MNKKNKITLVSTTNLADYAAREKHKEIGWRKYHETDDVKTRANGLNMIIEAHFARSILSSKRSHPELKVYAQHWLSANGSQHDEKIIMLLVKKYGLIKGELMIAPGSSYWNTNNSNDSYYRRYIQSQLSQ